MQTSYHNTVGLTGEALKKEVQNAKKQEDAILLIYLNTRKRYTAWDIHSLCQRAGKKWPVTSVRRGITNLMNAGHLVKLEAMKVGEYGKSEHYYQASVRRYPSAASSVQQTLL